MKFLPRDSSSWEKATCIVANSSDPREAHYEKHRDGCLGGPHAPASGGHRGLPLVRG